MLQTQLIAGGPIRSRPPRTHTYMHSGAERVVGVPASICGVNIDHQRNTWAEGRWTQQTCAVTLSGGWWQR